MRISFLNSLRFKIGIGYIILVLINVLVMVWTMYNFGKLTNLFNAILGDNIPNVIAVENMTRAIERHEHAISSTLNGDLTNGITELTESNNTFYASYREARDNQAFPEAEPVLDDIKSTYEGYQLLTDSLLELVETKKFDVAKMFYYNTIRVFSQRLIDNCFWLVEDNQKQIKDASRRAKLIADETILAIVFGSVLALALSIVTVVQFTKRIIVPAERLTDIVHQIGRGRLDLKIDIETTDEIGELSREFNKMTERLRRFEEMNIEKIVGEKQKSETIVASISDTLIVCDSRNHVQLLNRSAEHLLGVTEREAIGKRIDDLTSDERLLKIFRTPEDPIHQTQPYLLFNDHGKEIFLRPRISEIPSRYGGREGIVLVLQDVSQFKELDKAKSTFMATVSHEFRTPLTSINMGVDLLRQHLLGPLTGAQEEMMQSFKQDCERLTKLVRDLLQLSKLESGKIEMKEEAVHVNKLVEQSLQPLQLQLKDKQLHLTIDIDETIPPVYCNEQHLLWVVSNLLTNAIKHTQAGGHITISASVEKEMVCIRVEDTGKGIPLEFLNKIFDKFVQVKHNNDTTPGSVGLGLAIAKDIVEMYGGKIWVESTVNKGSTFSFQLPTANVKIL